MLRGDFANCSLASTTADKAETKHPFLVKVYLGDRQWQSSYLRNHSYTSCFLQLRICHECGQSRCIFTFAKWKTYLANVIKANWEAFEANIGALKELLQTPGKSHMWVNGWSLCSFNTPHAAHQLVECDEYCKSSNFNIVSNKGEASLRELVCWAEPKTSLRNKIWPFHLRPAEPRPPEHSIAHQNGDWKSVGIGM